MEISIKYQLITTVAAIIFGFVLGITYEIIRFFRIMITGMYNSGIVNRIYLKNCAHINNGTNLSIKTRIVYFLFDVIFFVLIAPPVLVFIFATSSGIVRWYICFGFCAGFTVYLITLKRLIRPLLEIVSATIKIALTKLYGHIKPFILKIKLALMNMRIRLYTKKKSKKKNINTESKKSNVLISYGNIHNNEKSA